MQSPGHAIDNSSMSRWLDDNGDVNSDIGNSDEDSIGVNRNKENYENASIAFRRVGLGGPPLVSQSLGLGYPRKLDAKDSHQSLSNTSQGWDSDQENSSAMYLRVGTQLPSTAAEQTTFTVSEDAHGDEIDESNDKSSEYGDLSREGQSLQNTSLVPQSLEIDELSERLAANTLQEDGQRHLMTHEEEYSSSERNQSRADMDMLTRRDTNQEQEVHELEADSNTSDDNDGLLRYDGAASKGNHQPDYFQNNSNSDDEFGSEIDPHENLDTSHHTAFSPSPKSRASLGEQQNNCVSSQDQFYAYYDKDNGSNYVAELDRPERLASTAASLEQPDSKPASQWQKRESLYRDFNTPSPDGVKVSGVLDYGNVPVHNDYALAAREESDIIEKQRAKIFDLQLKITQMEEQWKWTGDVAELQQKLIDSEVTCQRLRHENQILNEKLDHRSDQFHNSSNSGSRTEQTNNHGDDGLPTREQLAQENLDMRQQLSSVLQELGEYDDLKADYNELDRQRQELVDDIDKLVITKDMLEQNLMQLEDQVEAMAHRSEGLQSNSELDELEGLRPSVPDEEVRRLRGQNRSLLESLDAARHKNQSRQDEASMANYVLGALSDVAESVSINADEAYAKGDNFKEVFRTLLDMIELFIDSLLNEYFHYKNESERLYLELSRKDRELEDGQKTIQEQGRDLKRMESKQKRDTESREQADALLQKILSIVKEKYDPDATLSTLCDQMITAFKTVEDVQKMAIEVNEELRRSQDDHESAQERAKKLESSIAQLTSELEQVESSYHASQEEAQRAIAGRNEARAACETLAEENTSLKRELNSASTDAFSLEKQFRQLQGQLTDCDNERQDLQDKFMTEVDKVEHLTRKLDKSQLYRNQLLGLFADSFEALFGDNWSRNFISSVHKTMPFSSPQESDHLVRKVAQALEAIIRSAIEKNKHKCDNKCTDPNESRTWKSRFEDMQERHRLEVERGIMKDKSYSQRVYDQDCYIRKLKETLNSA